MMPPERPGDFAQAMMDLGATICRPRKPACPACPLRGDCTAFRSGVAEGVPAPKPRRNRRTGSASLTGRNATEMCG